MMLEQLFHNIFNTYYDYYCINRRNDIRTDINIEGKKLWISIRIKNEYINIYLVSPANKIHILKSKELLNILKEEW